MANREWVNDTEVVEIALRIKERFDEMFEHVDVSMIRFIRVMDKASSKIIEAKPVGFPHSIDNPYVFYFITFNKNWLNLTEEQRNLAVFQALYSTAPGSFDSDSENYRKRRKCDVKDYGVVLGAAGGNFFWQEAGVFGLPNILSEEFTMPQAIVSDEDDSDEDDF